MKILLFIGLLVCIVAAEQGKRIVGGTSATPVQTSYTVALVYNSNLNPPVNGYFCSGSIIDRDFVLTSASCLRDIYTTGGRNYDTNRNSIRIIVNHPNLTQPAPNSKIFQVDDIYFNTYNWLNGPVADLALLRADNDLLQGTGATRLYIANAQTASEGLEDPGVSGVVTGWGIVTPNTASGEYSNILQQVSVPVVSTSICQAASPSFTLTSNYLCAGAIGRTSCLGDEGGPLVVTVNRGGINYNVQIGIASLQSSTTQPRCDGSYGIFGKVSPFRSFIETFAGTQPILPTQTTTGTPSVTTGNAAGGTSTSSQNNDSQKLFVSGFVLLFLAFFI